MDWMSEAGRNGKRGADVKFVLVLIVSGLAAYFTSPLIGTVIFLVLIAVFSFI